MNSSQVNAQQLELNRLFVIIIAAFTICFTPFSVMTTMDAFRGQFSLPRELYFCETILIGLASSVNPDVENDFHIDTRGRIVPSTK